MSQGTQTGNGQVVISYTVTSTTGLASSHNPSTFGQSVTFTATVTGASPTGTVEFKDGSTDIAGCASQTLSSSSATCTTSALITGIHSITAVYSGDSANVASTSPVLTQAVDLTGSTVSVSSSANPSQLGYLVTFMAEVSGSSPIGAVTFKDGGTTIAGCGAVALSSAKAACTTSSLTAGSHSITALYSGDSRNAASVSGVLLQVVATQIDSMFLCYSKFEQDGGAVFEAQQAATLLAAGYWLPSALAGYMDGGDNLGAYHLQCNPAAELTPTGQWLDGGGYVIDATVAKHAGTGVYPIVA